MGYKNLDTLRQHKKIKKHMEYAGDSIVSDENELVKYKCEDCDKEYEAYEAFRLHKKNHTKWDCPLCYKSISKTQFKKHMELMHEENNIEIFKCKCRYETLSQEDLNLH